MTELVVVVVVETNDIDPVVRRLPRITICGGGSGSGGNVGGLPLP